MLFAEGQHLPAQLNQGGLSEVSRTSVMSSAQETSQKQRSTAELAEIVKRITAAAHADAVFCITESGELAKELLSILPESTRMIAATSDRRTAEALRRQGLETVHLPVQAANKYSQVRHALGVAVQSAMLAAGDLVICAFGRNVYPGEGDLIVVTDVGAETAQQGSVGDLLKLTDGIQPKVLEAALVLGCRIGHVVRRGAERMGAIFMLGDSGHVLQGSRQLVPNPFHGHDEALRRITKGYTARRESLEGRLLTCVTFSRRQE